MKIKKTFREYRSRSLDRKILRFWKYFRDNVSYIESGDKSALKTLRSLPYPLEGRVEKTVTGYYLRLRANRQKDFLQVEKYFASAPTDIEGWEFELKKPQVLKKVYTVNNHTYKLADFRFELGPHFHDGKMQIVVYYKGDRQVLSEPDNDDIGRYVLEEILGEEIAGRYTYLYERSMWGHGELLQIVDKFPEHKLFTAKELQDGIMDDVNLIDKYADYSYTSEVRASKHACQNCKSDITILNFTLKDAERVYICHFEMHTVESELFLFVTYLNDPIENEPQAKSTLAARWGQIGEGRKAQFGFSLYDAADSLPQDDKVYGHLMTRKEAKQTGLDKKLWEITDYIYLSPPKELSQFLQTVEVA